MPINHPPPPRQAHRDFKAVAPSSLVGGAFFRFWAPASALEEGGGGSLHFSLYHERQSIKQAATSARLARRLSHSDDK